MGCFRILTIVNSTAMNIEVHISFQIRVFIFSGYMPRGGIAGSYGNFMFSFLRNFHNVLHSGCINLFSYWQCRRFLFFPHSLPHLWFGQFLIIAILTGGRQYLMVLICISLILSNVEHLFTCLLTICMSSSKKRLFRSYTHLLFFFFKYWIVWNICIFWILTSVGCIIYKYFLSFHKLIVYFADGFFYCAKAFKFD